MSYSGSEMCGPAGPGPEAVWLQNCNFAIFNSLAADVILGVKSLQALQFRLGKNSIQVGPTNLSVCSVGPSEDSEELVLRDSIQIGEETWGLYVLKDSGEQNQPIFNGIKENQMDRNRQKHVRCKRCFCLTFSKEGSAPILWPQ